MKLCYEIRGNLLIIQEYPLHLYYEIKKAFSYNRIGYDRVNQKRTITPETIASGYDVNGKDVDLGFDYSSSFIPPKMIVTFHGYEQALIGFAKKHKLEVDRVVTQIRNDSVYVPQWDNIPEGFEFRYKQREVLELMGKENGGIILAAVGFGKSNCIGVMPCIYPNARILVCSYRKQVYAEIAKMLKKYVLPGTKMFVQSTKAITHHEVQQARVVVCGNNSLEKIIGYGDNYDYLVADEAHQACTPNVFRILSTLVRPKIYGLTGSFNRSDGAQFRLLGLCGPKLLDVDMRKAVEQGMTVPVKVIWCPVQLQYDPIAGCHVAYKKHKGIWHNLSRNKLIAGAARSYDENTQVLIMVETIKHAFALRTLLPEFFVASSETPDLDKIRGAFSKGTMKKIISTSVFREGVNFPNLSTLINATGVKSEIANIQLTGRVVRLGDNKPYGIVHDFYDNWNPEFRHYSAERKKTYEKQGFEQLEIQPSELLKNL